MSSFSYTINDSFSIDGSWWLPSQLEKKIPGTLTFEPGQKLSLDLHGAFEEEFTPFKEEGKINPSVINGISIDGINFTLLSCIRANSKWNLSYGYNQVWYEPRFVLSGACFASHDVIRFFECDLGLNLLPEWIGKWSPTPIPKSLPNGKMGLTIVLETENFFTTRISSIDTEISFVESFGTSKHSSGFRTIAYDTHSRIRIRPNEDKGLDWFLEVVTHLRNAFLVLTGIPFDISDVTFRAINPDESDLQFYGGEKVKLTLFSVQNVIHERSPVHPFHYPFSLKKVDQDALSRFFENWFEKKSQTETVFHLFLESVRDGSENWQVSFLTLTQAIETYHRAFRVGMYLHPEEYNKIFSQLVDAIPKGTPPDLRSSLKSRIAYGNEHSLRKRIKHLLSELGDDCKVLITDDVEGFVNRVIDTRNYLTHYADDLKAGVLDGADLYNTCLRLRLLILVLLLKDMGFSESYVVKGLGDKNHIVGFSYSQVKYSSTEA